MCCCGRVSLFPRALAGQCCWTQVAMQSLTLGPHSLSWCSLAVLFPSHWSNMTQLEKNSIYNKCHTCFCVSTWCSFTLVSSVICREFQYLLLYSFDPSWGYQCFYSLSLDLDMTRLCSCCIGNNQWRNKVTVGIFISIVESWGRFWFQEKLNF